MENQEFFVFRLGIKAEKTVALLTKEGGNWKLFTRPSDYPLIC
jgi:hypothetical protein